LTSTLSKTRIAQPSDEPEILHLITLMHAESGWARLDIDCVRETLAKAFERRGGIITVIGPPGAIRAMMYVWITHPWFSCENHLEELFCWVHPEHRRSDYSKLLIEEAKKYSDQISLQSGTKVPLLMGVLTNRRMAAKVRLYRRFFGLPVGAFFMHNGSWVCKDDPCEEDFWRLPSMAKWLRRHSNGHEKRRVGV
jgi:ribosomal protein S18 acetylase RimI-like enzyme